MKFLINVIVKFSLKIKIIIKYTAIAESIISNVFIMDGINTSVSGYMIANITIPDIMGFIIDTNICFFEKSLCINKNIISVTINSADMVAIVAPKAPHRRINIKFNIKFEIAPAKSETV